MNKELLSILIKTRFGKKSDEEQWHEKIRLWDDGKKYSEEEWDLTFEYYWDLDSI